MALTEKEKKTLESLKEKERQAKAEERNEAKKLDRLLKKTFGMSKKELEEKLSDSDYWWKRYSEQKDLIDRLLAALPRTPESFEKYVEFYEQKKAEKGAATDTEV